MKLKEIYQELTTNVKAAGIKHVMLYNSLLTDKPLAFPHAWVEFTEIAYEHITFNKTQVSTSAAIHLIVKSISENDLAFFQYRDALIGALVNAGYKIISEQQDTSYIEIIDWVITISIPPTIETHGT